MRQDSSYHALNEETVLSARSIKKSTGTYYTPQHLAELISRDAIFAWMTERTRSSLHGLADLNSLSVDDRLTLIEKINRIRVMDPSVGEGVFLLAGAEILSEILTTLGDDRTESQRRRSIVTNNLYGVELSEHGVIASSKELCEWASVDHTSNIRKGNSLIGFIETPEGRMDLDALMIQDMSKKKGSHLKEDLEKTSSFHWAIQFPDVFSGPNKGFDVILGNPPYGNILGMIERSHITTSYPFNVGKNRTGTWNSAAHFIVRAASMLKHGGQLGFLVPNSILRVKQFTKTREFILNHLDLWKIVDEGSPFEGVTLEMVSLFLRKGARSEDRHVQVESRRTGIKQSNVVDLSVLKKANVFPIYYDDFLESILERGTKNLLIATRGRDIPKNHTRRQHEEGYEIPYITSGRSVHRYRFNEPYMFYTNDWLFQDHALTESFENELLVATKNFRYPRCVIKPPGIVHGGGIVKIIPKYDNADLRVLGLILNSRVVRNICIRYLTNYSQLTCCLNTGIMEELPLILPTNNIVYSTLFDSLSHHYSGSIEPEPVLERISDALVYSLYMGEDCRLEEMIVDRLSESSTDQILTILDREVLTEVDQILGKGSVRELERLSNFPPAEKSLRY
jgi:hypothetical protein